MFAGYYFNPFILCFWNGLFHLWIQTRLFFVNRAFSFKIFKEMTSSVAPDEMTRNEPSHLDLHCLRSTGLEGLKGFHLSEMAIEIANWNAKQQEYKASNCCIGFLFNHCTHKRQPKTTADITVHWQCNNESNWVKRTWQNEIAGRNTILRMWANLYVCLRSFKQTMAPDKHQLTHIAFGRAQTDVFTLGNLDTYITETRLFSYIENFTVKNGKIFR